MTKMKKSLIFVKIYVENIKNNKYKITFLYIKHKKKEVFWRFEQFLKTVTKHVDFGGKVWYNTVNMSGTYIRLMLNEVIS